LRISAECERYDRRQQVQGGELGGNNFTKGKMERRLAQIEESVAHYLSQLDTQTAAGEAPSEQDRAAQGEADQARGGEAPQSD
jgi:hypothetical protein